MEDVSGSESETNEELDEDEDFEIANVDEYEYDIEELKNPESDHCLKCQKKYSSVHELAVCSSCFYVLSVNKTEAKKKYNLNDNDLHGLKYYPHNARYYTVYLYFLKEIRLKAIEKRFNHVAPSIDLYRNCVNLILEEAKERAIKTKERGQKMIATREKNRLKKQQQDEKRRQKRKKKLDKKLKYIDTDATCYDEYINGERDDFDNVVKKTKAYNKREKKLTDALAEKNLAIRSDSFYCQQYLEGNNFTLQEVVDMMEMMDFFVNRTNYFAITKRYLQKQYDDAKEYGYWDGERITLDESEKEHAKIEALKAYLKNHTTKSVPQVVLDHYLDYCQRCQYCFRDVRYVLELQDPIECHFCKKIKHHEMKLLLCSTQCPKLDWIPIEYLTKKRKTYTEVIYGLEHDDCIKCGKADNSLALFAGDRL